MNDLEFRPSVDGQTYERYRQKRKQRLVGVEDDMWAAFAENAAPHELSVDGHIVGCCAIDDERGLHAFYAEPEIGHLAEDLLALVIAEGAISAALVSTVDPAYLSLALTVAGDVEVEPVAIMYEHDAASETGGLDVRLAVPDDHGPAAAFCEAATGSGGPFLDGFLAERIELGELYLAENEGGRIVATGECRIDTRVDGYAHLGLIVAAEARNQGLGSRLMGTLAALAEADGLLPLCSTEPTNPAAQRVIHRAGFRSRHRVFRIPLGPR